MNYCWVKGAYPAPKPFFIIIYLLIQGTAHSANVSVCDQGCDFGRITESIDSAAPGDVIEVHSGTYVENIHLGKALILRGKQTGSGKPVIDAGGIGSAITISGDGAIVDGFNLTNSLGSDAWAGIDVISDNCTITNNELSNNDNGISITGFGNIIQGNDAFNNIYGMTLEESTNGTIEANILRDNNYGLLILSSQGNSVKRNKATNNDFGIQLNQSTGNVLQQNEMARNTYNFGGGGNNSVDTTNMADGKPIYYLVKAADVTLDSSSNAGAVYCIDCHSLIIEGLDLANNLYGIYLCNTSHSTLKGNRIRDNSFGILLINSSGNFIIDNQVSKNSYGIVLDLSRYNTLEGNKAFQSQAALKMTGSDYNRIIGNELSQSDTGAWVILSGLNLISGNIMTYNTIGAILDLSWLNRIFDNYVADNDQGILLESSTKNNLSANRIQNNTIGVLYDPLDNNTLDVYNQYLDNDNDLMPIQSKSTPPKNASAIKPSVSVDIDSKPRGAAILKGGKLEGETPDTVYFTDPGDYVIVLKKEGYKDNKLIIKIPDKITIETFTEEMREYVVKLVPEDNSTGGTADEE
ncbi:MAG: PEGA domain protein [Methanosaeta sp. PtaB.Bin039]|nr:MAG: PEGA domain protein [Methanosaeta sp. PtaB.Bin039]